MIKVVFDRTTSPVVIGGRTYTHAPIPDFQDRATERVLLRAAMRHTQLPENTPLPILRKRFEIRSISRPERKAMEAYFFQSARDQAAADRAARKAAAKAIFQKLVVSDDGGATTRPMTLQEGKAFINAIAFGLDLFEA